MASGGLKRADVASRSAGMVELRFRVRDDIALKAIDAVMWLPVVGDIDTEYVDDRPEPIDSPTKGGES